MVDVISTIHFFNMILVLATGAISCIWGFILFFMMGRVARDDQSLAGGAGVSPEISPPSSPPQAASTTKKVMNRSWRISLIVTAIIAALQGLLGLILVLLGARPGTGTGLYYLHYVYGAIVLLAIPVAVTYATSGKNPRRDVLIYSLASLILVAAAVRALMTGPS